MILVSIPTFSRSEITNKPKSITWPWRLTLKIKVKHMYRYELCYLWLWTWYRFDLGVDSSLLEVRDIKKARMNFMTLTFDLENQGQTYTYVTSFISGCIHVTDLILVLISTLSRSGISNKPKQITWPWRLTLKIKVKHTPTWPLLSLVVYMLQVWSWCRFRLSRGRGFQINQNKSHDLDLWPWELRSNIYLYDVQGQPSKSRHIFWFIWDPWPRICWNQH